MYVRMRASDLRRAGSTTKNEDEKRLRPQPRYTRPKLRWNDAKIATDREAHSRRSTEIDCHRGEKCATITDVNTCNDNNTYRCLGAGLWGGVQTPSTFWRVEKYLTANIQYRPMTIDYCTKNDFTQYNEYKEFLYFKHVMTTSVQYLYWKNVSPPPPPPAS